MLESSEDIFGGEYRLVWEVLDEFGGVVETTSSEDHARDIIADAQEKSRWYVNDRVIEIKEED